MSQKKAKRCAVCFEMRLEKAFQYAKANSFDAVANCIEHKPTQGCRFNKQDWFKIS